MQHKSLFAADIKDIVASQWYLLLGHCCPLQLLFGLRVFLLQLSVLLLQLVFLLQPLYLTVLHQPGGATTDRGNKCVLTENKD